MLKFEISSTENNNALLSQTLLRTNIKKKKKSVFINQNRKMFEKRFKNTLLFRDSVRDSVEKNFTSFSSAKFSIYFFCFVFCFS